jgi:hypothetical protein
MTTDKKEIAINFHKTPIPACVVVELGSLILHRNIGNDMDKLVVIGYHYHNHNKSHSWQWDCHYNLGDASSVVSMTEAE